MIYLPGLANICRLRGVKRTKALQKVAAALMADPTGRHYGYPISRQTGIRSGVLYPILHRLLAAGWLADGWETGTPWPARRYYELTDKGRSELEAMLADNEEIK